MIRASTIIMSSDQSSNERALKIEKWEHEVAEHEEEIVVATEEKAIGNLFTSDTAHFVDSGKFNLGIGVAIAANGLIMGIEVDVDLGLAGDVLNWTFTTTWTVEMIMRLFTYGPKKYFREGWNRMDFCLAWLSITDTWILPIALGSESGGGLRMLSILRVLRVARVMRLIKVLRVFQELWLLVHGLISAISVLVWVMVLLVMILYVGALVVTNMVGKECDEGDTFDHFVDCYVMYGTMPRSMYTLFQVMTLESWSMAVARPVLEEKPYMIIFFVGFLYLTTFGLMNIVMGVIVEQTLKSASENEEKLAKQRYLQQEADMGILRNIFVDADTDGQGTVTLEQFVKTTMRQDVQDLFNLLDIPVTRQRQATRLFDVLDAEGSGKMTINDLVKRCLLLKHEGQALVKDQTMLLLDVRSIVRILGRMNAFTSKTPNTNLGGSPASQVVPHPQEDLPSTGVADEGNGTVPVASSVHFATASSVQAVSQRLSTVEGKIDSLDSKLGNIYQIVVNLADRSQFTEHIVPERPMTPVKFTVACCKNDA